MNSNRKMSARVVIFVACVFAACAPARGEGSEATARETASSSTDDFRRLLLDRPEVPLTEPREGGSADNPPELPPDGSLVVDRGCRIRRDPASGWILLEGLRPAQGVPTDPVRALPCELLERIEGVGDKAPETVFSLTGESYSYNQRLYLLITRGPVVAAVQSAQAKPAERPAPRQPETRKPESDNAASARPATEKKKEPTSDDIFRDLMSDKPGKPLDMPKVEPRPEVAVESVAPKAEEAAAAPPDRIQMIVDRVVTLSAPGADGWREARFKSDNTLREPPLRLLPCRMLERAEKMGGQLRVTGLVTTYKGQRYMLLRKVLRERNLGQF